MVSWLFIHYWLIWQFASKGSYWSAAMSESNRPRQSPSVTSWSFVWLTWGMNFGIKCICDLKTFFKMDSAMCWKPVHVLQIWVEINQRKQQVTLKSSASVIVWGPGGSGGTENLDSQWWMHTLYNGALCKMCICSKGAILCLHGNASLLQILLCPLANTPVTAMWPRLLSNLIPSSHQGNKDLEHCRINSVVPTLWGLLFPSIF